MANLAEENIRRGYLDKTVYEAESKFNMHIKELVA